MLSDMTLIVRTARHRYAVRHLDGVCPGGLAHLERHGALAVHVGEVARLLLGILDPGDLAEPHRNAVARGDDERAEGLRVTNLPGHPHQILPDALLHPSRRHVPVLALHGAGHHVR